MTETLPLNIYAMRIRGTNKVNIVIHYPKTDDDPTGYFYLGKNGERYDRIVEFTILNEKADKIQFENLGSSISIPIGVREP